MQFTSELEKYAVPIHSNQEMNDVTESIDLKVDGAENFVSSSIDMCLWDICSFSPAYSDYFDDL